MVAVKVLGSPLLGRVSPESICPLLLVSIAQLYVVKPEPAVRVTLSPQSRTVLARLQLVSALATLLVATSNVVVQAPAGLLPSSSEKVLVFTVPV
ncbi:Putative protein [Zobellia galactanivorans]|uniref:Uncharacterized protein n=1 Tax=Zobellia galactanivorans (strain DSM 12802 / CCUG 47099 / CIP 106680 / NCIMB 13871 / Dsij) TaxID=63186 RepID=G0KZK4_ZOBGA|nr:Putative protein [Zobellia galactanivorans]